MLEGHRRLVVEDPVGAQALPASPNEVDFGGEFKIETLCAMAKQGGKGIAGIAFGDEPVLLKLGECGVVGLDRGVRGLQREEAHWA